MSVETIRVALGRLQDDPENEAAYSELSDVVTEVVTAPASDVSGADIERLLGSARGRHEQRREWGAVARLLELEIQFVSGSPVEAPMQAELARVYQEELIDAEKAILAYRRLLSLWSNNTITKKTIKNNTTKHKK